MSNSPPRLLICAAAATALLEDEIGELADAVVLLGGGDELGRRDRTLFGMGPARERFGADDPPRREVELGLIGDPHLAAVDRFVELAQHRQLPRGVLERLRVVIFPLEAVVRGFLGGDERAGEAVGERASAADLDSEGDRQVDRQARDPRRVAEQRVKRLEMIAERLRGSSNQAKIPPSPW